MWVIFAAVAILATPFLMAEHYRRARSRLKFADRVWGDLEGHAVQLLQDSSLPNAMRDLVEAAILHIGDGSLTRAFLLRIVWKGGKIDNAGPDEFSLLTGGQRHHFVRFMVDAMLYDSLRTTFSGAVVRRVVLYWLVATAKDSRASVNPAQFNPMAQAAGRAYHLAVC